MPVLDSSTTSLHNETSDIDTASDSKTFLVPLDRDRGDPSAMVKDMDATQEDQRVKVYVRVKPSLHDNDGQPCVSVSNSGISLERCDVWGDVVCLTKQSRHGEGKVSKQFVFDSVLDDRASQSDVYQEVAQPIVDDVLAGYNGTILAYGQTGAGKTHTLSSIKPECIGVIPRAAQDIFQKISPNDVVRLSYLQIYCEQIQDLLKPETGDNLSIREGKKGRVYVPELSETVVTCLDDCLRLLQLGDRNRSVAFTALNAHSSRSHAVVMFTIIRHDTGTKNRVGRLFLVDLAGSERLKKSKSVDQRAVEARAINLSLTTLGKCVSARAMGLQHVPFRDSKLTRLLQESLGGNAKTSMIIAIRADENHADETYQSLEFGSRAMHVTTHAEVNVLLQKGQDDSEKSQDGQESDQKITNATEAFLNLSLDAGAFMELKKEKERSQQVIECLEQEKVSMMEEHKKIQLEQEEMLRAERWEKEAFQSRALMAESKATEAESVATKKIDELRIQLDRALEQLDDMEEKHEAEIDVWRERLDSAMAAEATSRVQCDVLREQLFEKSTEEDSMRSTIAELKARIECEVQENNGFRSRILSFKKQMEEEEDAKMNHLHTIAELQNMVDSTIAERDALKTLISSKENEHGKNIKTIEESIESKYRNEMALCTTQIQQLKTSMENSRSGLNKTQNALKEIQDYSRKLQSENESLKSDLEAAKMQASRYKRQAKEAIFKFDILSRHQRHVERQNKAATTIQRAYRQYRLCELRKERHSEFEELARTKHALGDLAAKHAEMAAKRNSNLAFTGHTLLGEGLDVLQEAVEGILTTFLLPSKDLKALQRYNTRMKSNQKNTDANFRIPASYQHIHQVKSVKNRNLNYYDFKERL